MGLEEELEGARSERAESRRVERAAQDELRRSLDDARRQVNETLAEAVSLIRAAGLRPTVVEVRGQGTLTRPFKLGRAGWRLDQRWGLTEAADMTVLTQGYAQETTTGGVWTSGQAIKPAVRYNKRLRRFTEGAGYVEPVWFDDAARPDVKVMDPTYVEYLGSNLYYHDGRVFMSSATETYQQFIARCLVTMGV